MEGILSFGGQRVPVPGRDSLADLLQYGAEGQCGYVKTILIADDQPEILEILEVSLSGFGEDIRLRTAHNGREAIDRLAAEPIDLVVTDLAMPVVDGFQVLAHMMGNYPSIPVIVMTAYGSPTTRHRLNEFEPQVFVEKPFDPVKLVDRIRGVLRETATGRVEGITLASFLQLLHLETKTCLVRVTSNGRSGMLKLASGDLVDAQYGDRRGKAAAFEILGWEGVEIRMDPNVRASERTIEKSLEYILLEAAAHRDETCRKEEHARIDEETPRLPESVELVLSRFALDLACGSAGTESFLQALGKALKWDSAVLWTKVSGRDLLRRESLWSLDAAAREALELRREIDLTIPTESPAQAWATGRATGADDLEDGAARCGFHSAAAFPVLAGEQGIGVIELLAMSRRELDSQTLDWLTALGSRLPRFLDRARSDQRRADVIEQEQEALNRIHAREARLSFLAETSAVLACALDESVLWQTFARLVVPRIAEWCVLDVIEPTEEHRLTVFHRDLAMLEWTEELRLRGSRASEPWSPVARVLRTGVAEIYRGSALDRDAGIFARLGFECAMVVPVVARARVFGVATLVSAPPTAPFGPEELTMSQDLAHRMALAVGNARQARSRAAAPGIETPIESCPSLTG